MEIDIVPMDMTEEILLRLPVKSLLRFKCVSKNWCALIRSKRFIDLHYSHASNQDRLVFRITNDRFEDANGDRLWLPYIRNVMHVMGPIKGVFCEVCPFRKIILWNPASLMVKQVPILPSPLSSRRIYALAFGFGLEPSSGDYKIVAFEGRSSFAFVYSSSSDCWKRIGIEIEGSSLAIMNACYTNRYATFLNGVYYWPVKLGPSNFSILAFDMTFEKFGGIKIPSAISDKCGENIRMVVWGDSIGLLSWCEFWVMERRGCWSKCFEFSALGRQMSPLYVWKNEILMLDESNSDLIGVDVTTQRVRRVEVSDKWSYGIFSLFAYKESLVPVGDEGDYKKVYF